jgi:chemotaxis signal transduction protein
MKIASQDAVKPRRMTSSEPMILFSVAHQTFAIAADAVQEIRSTDSLAGAAMEFEQSEVPKVHHTIERAHRTYYVVNAGAHFGLPVTRPTLVLILRQLRSAVLVDRIERMVDISAVHSLPRAFTGQERKWYRGLTYLDDHVIPVIQPNGFLTPDEFNRLDRTAKMVAEQRQLEGAVQA